MPAPAVFSTRAPLSQFNHAKKEPTLLAKGPASIKILHPRESSNSRVCFSEAQTDRDRAVQICLGPGRGYLVVTLPSGLREGKKGLTSVSQNLQEECQHRPWKRQQPSGGSEKHPAQKRWQASSLLPACRSSSSNRLLLMPPTCMSPAMAREGKTPGKEPVPLHREGSAEKQS